MSLQALRAISSVAAAVTGLLLVYDIIYAMEGMTTRVPMNPLHELGITTLWMLPWTMLFCFGLEDFGTVTRQAWVFWAGVILALAFLYYFERNTSSSIVTKTAMPLLAAAGGLMPHVIRRINLVFTVLSIAAGIAGLVVFYLAGTSYLSGSSFQNKSIGFVVLAFGTASLIAGVLSVALLRRRHNRANMHPLTPANS
jgi:hypothetical protein